ncbi:DNA-binding LacI/PurR family transcriptional regulator [Microbacterium marinum]|uniref:DNA-binding LacI/PurR family transcriptional regulator n=1 Tax=Microbacterium marinum TaxID=421115 RepID=A0A7W7FM17_9MICO|nr:LacI family DNA-binding transcriptional regulator [Microbacterium marinum]MBB4667959.1 DNA-binding LacI/PurR family transcriptional regulator [Microbacterium marinum]HCJ48504.1 LacI family transcriptional regulator [Microbacterium sp.]
MSTIADVATRAGVSKATASRALTGRGYVSDETRVRVAQAARELSYVAHSSATSLATGRTQTVGVVMPHVNRWFFAEVLEGIQLALLERGLDLTLYDATPGSASRRRVFEDFLARRRFDGLIAVGLEPAESELDALLALGKPVVSVIGTQQSTSVVTLDDSHAAVLATAHLIELGHRRIAFLGGTDATHWPHVESARYAGYEAEMRRAGLEGEITRTPAELSMPAGYAAAVDLLSDAAARPTGIVAACDEVAIGAIIAARRLGILVPSTLSVVGIDDHVNAEMFSLTTLRQVPREQGRAAVELLVRHLEDPDAEPVTLSIKPRLVVRGTTAGGPGRTSAAVRDSGFAPQS